MSKVTLIWFPGHHRPFRSLSLSRKALVTLGAVVGVVLVASLVNLVLTGWFAGNLAWYRVERDRLASEVAEQRSALERLQTQKAALDTRHKVLLTELEKIKEMEGKIRQFLGLAPRKEADKPPAATVPQSSTATAPAGATSLAPETPLSSPEWAESLSAAEAERMVQLTRPVEESFKQSLAAMKKRPTLIPVGGDGIYLSGGFGWRQDPVTGNRKEFHTGLDIAGPYNAPIIAPGEGVITEVGQDAGLGLCIKLRHDSGIVSVFGHLASSLVQPGQRISRGQQLGRMGNSGRTTGTHVHYAIIEGGRFVNPLDFIWGGSDSMVALRK